MLAGTFASVTSGTGMIRSCSSLLSSTWMTLRISSGHRRYRVQQQRLFQLFSRRDAAIFPHRFQPAQSNLIRAAPDRQILETDKAVSRCECSASA